MSLADELARRIGARRIGAEWRCRCPLHQDEHASCDFRDGASGVVFQCRSAGCSSADLARYFREQHPDLFGAGKRHEPEAEFEIFDAAGRLLAIHVRWGKTHTPPFTWRQPSGASGLGGLKAADLLYRLPELLAAKAEAEGDAEPPLVVVTEGEKAADGARRLGFVAVGTVTGASSTPSETALRALQGCRVILWADNDPQGRLHMGRIAARLAALDVEVVGAVHWPDAPSKGDAADFRGSRDDVLRMVREETSGTDDTEGHDGPRFAWAADFLQRVREAPDPGFAIEGLLPGEGIFHFHARPRAMKSLSLIECAVAMATATPAFSRYAVPRALRVGYLTEEDAERLVAPRAHWFLVGRGLTDRDAGHLALLCRPGWNLERTEGRDALLRELERLSLDVLIIDPVRASMPSIDAGPHDAARAVETARLILRETSVRLLGFGAHDVKPSRDGQDSRKGAERASGGIIYSISDAPIGMSRVTDRECLATPSGFKQGADPEPFTIRWESATPRGQAFREWVRAVAEPYAEAEDGESAEQREILLGLIRDRGAVTTSEAETALNSTRKGAAARLLAALQAARIVVSVTGRDQLRALAAALNRPRSWPSNAIVWTLPAQPPPTSPHVPPGDVAPTSPAPPTPRRGEGGGGQDRAAAQPPPDSGGGCEADAL